MTDPLVRLNAVLAMKLISLARHAYQRGDTENALVFLRRCRDVVDWDPSSFSERPKISESISKLIAAIELGDQVVTAVLGSDDNYEVVPL